LTLRGESGSEDVRKKEMVEKGRIGNDKGKISKVYRQPLEQPGETQKEFEDGQTRNKVVTLCESTRRVQRLTEAGGAS